MQELKFYNREKELKFLKQLAKQSVSSAQFLILYGIRRVGKTYLLKYFANNYQGKQKHNILYFAVARKSEYLLLQEWQSIAEEKLQIQIPQFTRLIDLLNYLFALSRIAPFIIIIDEFQDITYINNSIFSELRNLWDKYKTTARLFFIVSGSSYSLLNKIFRDKKEPLFGRADSFLKIEPFNIQTFIEILHDYDLKNLNTKQKLEHITNIYSVFGTFPKYLSYLVEKRLLNKNITQIFRKTFLDVDEFFREEGKFLLINDLGRESDIYFSILQAISLGAKTTTQIAKTLNTKAQYLTRYLDVLNNLDLISKNTGPFKLGTTYYTIKNPYLAFYMSFVYKNHSYFEAKEYEYLLKLFKRTFPTYKGKLFELFVKQILTEKPIIKDKMFVGKFIQKDTEIDLIVAQEKVWHVFEIKYKPYELQNFKVPNSAQKIDYLKNQLDKHNKKNIQIIPYYFTLLPIKREQQKSIKMFMPDIKFMNLEEVLQRHFDIN